MPGGMSLVSSRFQTYNFTIVSPWLWRIEKIMFETSRFPACTVLDNRNPCTHFGMDLLGVPSSHLNVPSPAGPTCAAVSPSSLQTVIPRLAAVNASSTRLALTYSSTSIRTASTWGIIREASVKLLWTFMNYGQGAIPNWIETQNSTVLHRGAVAFVLIAFPGTKQRDPKLLACSWKICPCQTHHVPRTKNQVTFKTYPFWKDLPVSASSPQ